jgi:hypothetical protein
MSKDYYMAVFTCLTPDVNAQGRQILKTISSYVEPYFTFERTVNNFAKRFALQNYSIKEITVFYSDINFRSDWENIKADESINWRDKNAALLQRRHDVQSESVFCAEDFKPRRYGR